MNKLLQTTLITAIMATSGFATQQDGGTISGVGHIDEGAGMEMEANIRATMDNNAVIHNYGIIQGPAATAGDGTSITVDTPVGNDSKATISNLEVAQKAMIQGTNAERIINYDHIMEKDADFGGLTDFEIASPTYFRPTGGGRIQGAVDTTYVTVTSERADLGRAIDLHNASTDVMLLTLDCLETDRTMRLTNSEEEMKTVKANIANEVMEDRAGGSNSHSLVVRGGFRFEGDQSRFNQEETTLRFSNSHSEIATPKSLFMRPIDVSNKSELVIDAAGVEMPHNVTVTNSQFIVNENASFTIKSGAKLLFKYLKELGYPSENPKQMVWADGSFDNELTPVNKNFYKLSFEDGSTLRFYYDEGQMQWGRDLNSQLHDFSLNEVSSDELQIIISINENMTTNDLDQFYIKTQDAKDYYKITFGYDQFAEIYRYKDTSDKYSYKMVTEGYTLWKPKSGDILNISSDKDIIVRTLNINDLNPSYKQILYYKDDVFSYNYDATLKIYSRRAPYMFFQPNSILSSDIDPNNNSTWRIFELPNIVSAVNMPIKYIIVQEYDFTLLYINSSQLVGGNKFMPATYSSQIIKEYSDEKKTGLWVENFVDEQYQPIIKQLDEWARNHSFEETWYTLDEYNAKKGTAYTWG